MLILLKQIKVIQVGITKRAHLSSLLTIKGQPENNNFIRILHSFASNKTNVGMGLHKKRSAWVKVMISQNLLLLEEILGP